MPFPEDSGPAGIPHEREGNHRSGPHCRGATVKEWLFRLRLLTLNSDLYDYPALYDALLPVGAHVPYYAELARQASGHILELACGTGQLTVPLASAGLSITGLDLSEPMLNTARERAATAKVLVEYVLGDMRNFSLSRQFALIFIARNSLLHLHSTEDLLAAFAMVRRHAEGLEGIFAVRHIQSKCSLTREAFWRAFSRFSKGYGIVRRRSFGPKEQTTTILPHRWAAAAGTFRFQENRMPGCSLSICVASFRRSCRCCSRREAFTSKAARKILSKRRSIPPAACKCASARR